MDFIEIVALIIVVLAFVYGVSFILKVYKLLAVRLHPDECPICGIDLEHSGACFGCPFVVVDSFKEQSQSYYMVPDVCHCGLKDKKYLLDLKNSREEKLIEKI